MASTAKSGGGGETAQFGKGDLGIVNYALTLEYLETAFYADVVKSGLFKGSEPRRRSRSSATRRPNTSRR